MYYYNSTMSSRRVEVGPTFELLDGYALGEIARLVDVAAAPDGDVVREQLQRDHHERRRQQRVRAGNGDEKVLRRVEQLMNAVVAFGGKRDDRTAARLGLL